MSEVSRRKNNKNGKFGESDTVFWPELLNQSRYENLEYYMNISDKFSIELN